MNRYGMAAARELATSVEATRAKKSRKKYIRTKKVASQALFYVGAFYATWVFGTINRLQQLVSSTPVFGLMLMHSIFVPMQGALNFFVYTRPRFVRWRQRRKKERIKRAQQREEIKNDNEQADNSGGEDMVANASPNIDSVGMTSTNNQSTSRNKSSLKDFLMRNSIWGTTLSTKREDSDYFSRLGMTTIRYDSDHDRHFEGLSDDEHSIDDVKITHSLQMGPKENGFALPQSSHSGPILKSRLRHSAPALQSIERTGIFKGNKKSTTDEFKADPM